MRTFLLSLVLAVATFGATALTPADANADWRWRRGGYYTGYYYPPVYRYSYYTGPTYYAPIPYYSSYDTPSVTSYYAYPSYNTGARFYYSPGYSSFSYSPGYSVWYSY